MPSGVTDIPLNNSGLVAESGMTISFELEAYDELRSLSVYALRSFYLASPYAVRLHVFLPDRLNMGPHIHKRIHRLGEKCKEYNEPAPGTVHIGPVLRCIQIPPHKHTICRVTPKIPRDPVIHQLFLPNHVI